MYLKRPKKMANHTRPLIRKKRNAPIPIFFTQPHRFDFGVSVVSFCIVLSIICGLRIQRKYEKVLLFDQGYIGYPPDYLPVDIFYLDHCYIYIKRGWRTLIGSVPAHYLNFFRPDIFFLPDKRSVPVKNLERLNRTNGRSRIQRKQIIVPVSIG